MLKLHVKLKNHQSIRFGSSTSFCHTIVIKDNFHPICSISPPLKPFPVALGSNSLIGLRQVLVVDLDYFSRSSGG